MSFVKKWAASAVWKYKVRPMLKKILLAFIGFLIILFTYLYFFWR